MDVFRKLPWESNLNHKSSSFLSGNSRAIPAPSCNDSQNPTIQKPEKIEVTLSSRANTKKILSPTRGTTVAVLGHCARSKLPQLVGIEANTRKQSLE
jgi:hypothetical protein